MILEFSKLIQSAEEGSEAAVWELVERFSPHIYRVVRRRLSPTLRRRFDSTDFVQMTWASFLLRERSLLEFKDEMKLQAFLAGIAANKVLMGARQTFDTLSRDIKREMPLDSQEQAPPHCREPSPSQVVAFRDAWETYLSRQPPHYRRIVQLRLTGMTCQAIADELKLHERTIRRVLKNLCAEVAA